MKDWTSQCPKKDPKNCQFLVSDPKKAWILQVFFCIEALNNMETSYTKRPSCYRNHMGRVDLEM